MALFFEDGSFVLSALGKGGAWEEVDFTEGGSGMLLKPDAGGQIFLEERPWGYLSDAIRLVRTSAEFAGFWHDFEPSSPLYLPLTRQGWRKLACPCGAPSAVRACSLARTSVPSAVDPQNPPRNRVRDHIGPPYRDP